MRMWIMRLRSPVKDRAKVVAVVIVGAVLVAAVVGGHAAGLILACL
jgi:hypothetical protein